VRLHFKDLSVNAVCYENRAKSVNTHQGQSVYFPNVTAPRFILLNSRVIVSEEFCHRFIQD
jgi:hypothetical protein